MKSKCKYLFGCEYDYGYGSAPIVRGFCSAHYSAYALRIRRSDLTWDEVERITSLGMTASELEKESIKIIRGRDGVSTHNISRRIKLMNSNNKSVWS